MAITFVAQGAGASQGSSTEGATFSPALPASFAVSDFAICLAATERGTLSISSGWSALSLNPIANSGNYKMYVWYRTLASGDSNPTLTMSNLSSTSTGAVARIGTFRAVKLTSQIDATGTANSGTGTSVSNTGVTTVAQSAMLISVVMTPTTATTNNDGTFNSVAATKRIGENTGNYGGANIGLYSLEQTTAGASGSFASTIGSSQAWASASFSIAPNTQPPTRANVASQAVTRSATR